MKTPHIELSGNDILSALSRDEVERLLPALTPYEGTYLEVLIAPGARIEHLYFPLDSVISLVATTADGRSAEVGLIGREGFAGYDVLLAGETASNQNVMQIGSRCLRLPREVAIQEFEREGTFRKLTLEFVHHLITQVSQTALCNRLHSLEERLSRWLLMCSDRVSLDELPLTQELLAFMVGTTRTSISTTAANMQELGLISYRRGAVTIKDRKGLERFACDCYQTVKLLNSL